MTQNLKAIIFDVDGVVFKSLDSDGKYLWSKTIKEDLGLRREHFQKIFSKQWDCVTKGKIDTKDYLSEVFKDEIFANLNLTVEGYIDYWLSHDNYVDQEIINFVYSLDIPAYLGTNQDPYRTRHIQALVGDAFKGIFTSYQIGYLKPEKGFYHHIERALDLKPNELLLVDDTLENLNGAKENGWNTYFYQGDFAELKSLIT
jgi:putative hydrolase of the HAD superfamily